MWLNGPIRQPTPTLAGPDSTENGRMIVSRPMETEASM